MPNNGRTRAATICAAALLGACQPAGPLSQQFTDTARWEPVAGGSIGSIETRNSIDRTTIRKDGQDGTATVQIIALNHDLPWGGRVAQVEVKVHCIHSAVDFLRISTFTPGGSLVMSGSRADLVRDGWREFQARPGTAWWQVVQRICR